MKTYSIFMEGYIVTGGRCPARYVGEGKGETFAEASYDACVKAYGKEETDRFFTRHNDNATSYWGCRMYDNYHDAAKSFG